MMVSLTLRDFFKAFVSHDCERLLWEITGNQPVIFFVGGGWVLEYVADYGSNGIFDCGGLL